MARSSLYERGEEEFTRVLAFSDAIYAIAMTLLVVGIGLPTLTHEGDEGELLGDLGDASSEIFSFFLSFAVIGRYWVAHHEFFARLRAVDTGSSASTCCTGVRRVPALPDRPARELLRERHRGRPLRADGGRRERSRGGAVLAFVDGLAVSPAALRSRLFAFLSTTAAVAVWLLFVPVQLLLLNPRKPPDAA